MLFPIIYVGQRVLVKYKHQVVSIFHDDKLLVSYTEPKEKGQLVQNPSFYQALREDTQQLKRKYAMPLGKAKRFIGASSVRVHETVYHRDLSVGVGKTHLSTSLAIKACYSGTSIYFTTLADLIEKLGKDAHSMKKARGRSYYKSRWVVVDEVGYTPLNREEAHLFFQFISIRYEQASTVITSNKSFTEWGLAIR